MYKLVLVDFPFTEKAGIKSRPSLLLTDGSYGKHKIVLVAYVTSQGVEDLISEVKISKSSKNGLMKDSVVKLHKIVNIPVSMIRGELGELNKDESLEVKLKLKKLLGLL